MKPLLFCYALLIALLYAGPGKEMKKGSRAGQLKTKQKSDTDGFGYGDCTCKKDSGKYKQKDMTLKYLDQSKVAKKITFYDDKSTSNILCEFTDVQPQQSIKCDITNSPASYTQFPTESGFRIEYADGVTPDCVGSFHTSCSKDIIGWLGDGCEELQVTQWSSTDPNAKDCLITNPGKNMTTTRGNFCVMQAATFMNSNGYPFVSIMQRGFDDAYCFYIERIFEASYYQTNQSTNPAYTPVSNSEVDLNIDKNSNIKWYYTALPDRFRLTVENTYNPSRFDNFAITFNVQQSESNENQCRLKYSVDLNGYQWVDDSDDTKFVLVLQFVDCKDDITYKSKKSKSKTGSKKSTTGLQTKTKTNRRVRRLKSSVKGTKKSTTKRKSGSRKSKPGMSDEDSHEFNVGIAELFEPGIALSYNCPNATKNVTDTVTCKQICDKGYEYCTSQQILVECCCTCAFDQILPICEGYSGSLTRRRLVDNQDISVTMVYHTTNNEIHSVYDRFCDLNADPNFEIRQDLAEKESDFAFQNYNFNVFYHFMIVFIAIFISFNH